jgi:hypothetical protein
MAPLRAEFFVDLAARTNTVFNHGGGRPNTAQRSTNNPD